MGKDKKPKPVGLRIIKHAVNVGFWKNGLIDLPGAIKDVVNEEKAIKAAK